MKNVIRKIIKPRFSITRTRFLINNPDNTFFWGLNYKYRRYLYVLVHPFRYILLNKMKEKEVLNENTLSLKPFKETNSIFIRIPKSAGRSLSKTIYGCLVGSHTKLRDYQLIFSESELEKAFKFTIVRNPWDRLVSAYFFLKEGGVCNQDKMFADKYLSNVNDFEDFVVNYLRKEEIISFTHFIPQFDFLLVQEKLDIDFIGYFENLEEDYNHIKSKFGIDEDVLLMKKNITKSRKIKSYHEYYNEKTKKIVAEIYAKDIELFGYDFDNILVK